MRHTWPVRASRPRGVSLWMSFSGNYVQIIYMLCKIRLGWAVMASSRECPVAFSKRINAAVACTSNPSNTCPLSGLSVRSSPFARIADSAVKFPARPHVSFTGDRCAPHAGNRAEGAVRATLAFLSGIACTGFHGVLRFHTFALKSSVVPPAGQTLFVV